MINVLSNYILLHPSLMVLLFYPSYFISFILFVGFIFRFRITGILLIIHSIITYFLLNNGEKIDTNNPTFYHDTKFSPQIFDIPIYSLITIPIIIFLGFLLDYKIRLGESRKAMNSKK